MSEEQVPTRVVRQRVVRQHWAAPGGSQDRVVRTARIALPLGAVALIALLTLAPLAKDRDVSFLLDKNKVDVASERMRVDSAQYRGTDNNGQAFSLTARAAVQPTSTDPVVHMNDLAARIQLRDGPASLTAGRGRYDMTAERVAMDGPLTFQDSGGYKLTTSDVVADLKTRTMASNGGQVEGKMPLGTFSAGRLRADLDARHVILDGRVRLKIVQGGLK